MVSKKKGKSSARKSVSKKTSVKTKKVSRASAKKTFPKAKETVRVKTFIVEKPVYVQAPSLRKHPPANLRHPDYFKVLDARKSRYAKDEPVEDEPLYSDKKEDYSDAESEDSEAFDDFPDGDGEGQQNDKDNPEFAESGEEFADGEQPVETTDSGHKRSRAMFTSVWWKRAFWQSAAIWLAIFIFAFFMDLINLSTVELQRNWIYLFVGIFAAMLVYQKFLKGRFIK